MAQNTTGSTVVANTPLFFISSSARPLSGVLQAYANNTICVCGVSSNGNIACSIDIPNNQFIFINISYAIA